MIINNNISAQNTYRQLSMNNAAQAKSMEKLSSGLRINRGADDAAGLSISEKMRSQIRGLDQASRNAQDGISLIQTADGALNETHSILQRMRELGVQASNETNTTEDWAAIQKELDALIDEIDNIADNTKFNGRALLNGDLDGITQAVDAEGDPIEDVTVGAAVNITIGPGHEALGINIKSMRSDALGTIEIEVEDDDNIDATLSTFKTTHRIDDGDNERINAQHLIRAVDEAIKQVSAERSELGANQNRLEFTTNNLASTSQNLRGAESRIRDVDMAKEILENSKNGILAQAAQAMLSQANQQPQSVLQLLR